MAVLGRSRLAAAAGALVASFAVVLAIGAFTGGSPSQHATARPVTLTVKVTATRDGLVQGLPVTVLRVHSLTSAASGRVSSAGMLQGSVPSGSYLVCLRPPGGWSAADPDVIRLPGWVCISRVLSARSTDVTFMLTPAAGRTPLSNR